MTSITMTGTCALQDLLPHMGGALRDPQMQGTQVMDAPHPGIHIPITPLQNAFPLRGLATIRSTPTGNLTGINSLIESPVTQTRPLALMKNTEGENPLPADHTMTLTVGAQAPMPDMFHSRSRRTKAKHDDLMTGTSSIPRGVVSKSVADFNRETATSW